MTTMNRTTSSTIRETWDLAENAVMRVSRRGIALVVRVERGTVLVTRQGDLEDHVLEPGDELVLPRGGLAVAWAFTEATISVREAVRTGATLEPSLWLAITRPLVVMHDVVLAPVTDATLVRTTGRRPAPERRP